MAAVRRRPKASIEKLEELLDQHPFWTPRQFANRMGCDPAYVRAMKQRHKLPILTVKEVKALPFTAVVEKKNSK